MTDLISLAAQARTRGGKGAARATRRAGSIPAVIYGDKQPPAMIVLDPKEVTRELHRPGFFTRRMNIAIDGKQQMVLPRDVQFDPVTDRPIHFDFLRISPQSIIQVGIPVVFLNEAAAPGIKRGGVLNVVRHTIEVRCRADAIPDKLEVDLTGLEIGHSVHISKVTLPAGVKPVIADRDFTVCTVVAPTVAREQAAEAQAAAAAGTPTAEEAAAAEAAAAAAGGAPGATGGAAPAGAKGAAPAGAKGAAPAGTKGAPAAAAPAAPGAKAPAGKAPAGGGKK